MTTTPHRIRTLFLATGLMLIPLSLAAQTESETPPTTNEYKEKTVLDYYSAGGPMMHVLLFGSIATIGLIVYCAISVSPGKMTPKRLVDSLNRTMADRDIQNAYQLCEENPCSYSKCLSGALLKVNFDRDLANKASMMDAAEDTLDHEETRQMNWINYLNSVATLAPMLGLLGTVFGMIQAFGKLTAGQTKASELAGGIETAMVTTAGGLLVGIPSMFAYFFFRNRLAGIMAQIQRNFSFAIDVLSGEIQLQNREK
ncbi:MAG: biopolymer transport protein ExbB [Verrucomicrobiales bacterium]|jgi:biopolymer transport protein ExbB